jgi:lipopolysaccharide export system permease protein
MILTVYVVPASFQKFRQQEHLLRSAFSGALLKEGSFNTTRGFTVYIRSHNDRDELHGVFIYQPPKKDQPSYTTMAKTGQLIKSGERILILLKEGQRQEYDPITRRYSYFGFDEFVYDLTDALSSSDIRPEKAYEKSLSDLLNPSIEMQEEMKNRYRAEAHQRILLPFLCLLDALFITALVLSGDLGRRYNRRNLVWAAFGVFFFHLVTLGLLQSSVRHYMALNAAYIFVFGSMLLSLRYLLRDMFNARFR